MAKVAEHVKKKHNVEVTTGTIAAIVPHIVHFKR